VTTIRPAVGLLLAAFLVLGCEPGERGEVRGKVLLDGSPVTGGTVIFRGADGKESRATIGPGGSYKVSDVAVGEATIAVANRPIPMGLRDPAGPGAKSEPPPAVIPERYKDPKTSKLTCRVTSGEQTYTIELRREPGVSAP
jgi:hypothetical protein